MFDVSKYALASSERLLNLFHEGFNVVDLAQPLLSLDEWALKSEAQKLFEKDNIPVLGVRRGGRVVGYVRPEDVKDDGDLSTFRKFEDAQMLGDTSNLEELFVPLVEHEFMFIEVVGEVACIVTRDDLEKPPMRMWLFGIITLLEMNVTWAITQIYPDNAWCNLTSKSRLEKAQMLQDERARRNQHATLLSCLQFSDKLHIMGKEKLNRDYMNIKSHKEAKELIKSLESLRNNLAHAQPVIKENWRVILRLSQDIESVISAPGIRRLVDHVKESRIADKSSVTSS